MFGLNSRIYREFGNLFYKLFVCKLIKIGAEYSFRRIGNDAELSAYGNSRISVVSGNHNRAYSRLAAFLYSRLDLGTDRVNHAGQTDKDKILLKIRRVK